MSWPFLERKDDFGQVFQHGRFQVLLLPTYYCLIVHLYYLVALLYFAALMRGTLEFHTADHVYPFIGCLDQHTLLKVNQEEQPNKHFIR